MLDLFVTKVLSSAGCSFIFGLFNDTGNRSENVPPSDRTINEK